MQRPLSTGNARRAVVDRRGGQEPKGRIGILLLDLSPGSPLAAQLSEILQRAGDGCTFELDARSVDPDGEPLDLERLDLESMARRGAAEAVFLVLPESPSDFGGALDPIGVPTFAVTADDDPAGVFEVLRQGITDLVQPPLTPCAVLPRLWRALEHLRPASRLQRRVLERAGLRGMVGKSPAFCSQIEKIPLLAKSDAAVLVTGETGTGKELVARAVHYLSPRSSGPFVPVNCGAIPETLIENELFGHERSAYTGADSTSDGLLQEANGGTLFLDEVDSLPTLAQTKLLRFLQSREYRRLGSTRTRHSDVRVVAASNARLDEAVGNGSLRLDLFYRLNVLPVALPPLRRRSEDIPLLAGHFLSRFAAQSGGASTGFTAEAMEALIRHDWPGNVRELKHVVERAIIMSGGRALIERVDLGLQDLEPSDPESFREAKARTIAEFERGYIEKMLTFSCGNISVAARAAKKNRRAFWELLRKHGIDADRFRSWSAG